MQRMGKPRSVKPRAFASFTQSAVPRLSREDQYVLIGDKAGQPAR